MSNLIKIYHYCYWVTIVEGVQNTARIEKECHYGFLDEKTLEIKCPIKFDLVYEDCALYANCEYDEDYICIDFFTVDEINGYESFINYALNCLSKEVICLNNKNKGDE